MSKKVVIKENIIDEPEETREEILEQIEEPQAPAPKQSAPQKAEGRTRMRELYRCEYCGKYLTKKALNYSHTKYCKGQQPEQPPEEIPQEVCEIIEPQLQPQPQLSIMEQIRQQRLEAKRERIARLSQNIA